MDQVKEVLHYHHYDDRTEVTYCQWILRYIHYYGGKTCPQDESIDRELEAALRRRKEGWEIGLNKKRNGKSCT